MIPEVGHFLVISAWVIVICQGVLPLVGASSKGAYGDILMSSARMFAYLHFGLLSAALAALIYSFIQDDFTVAYVANNSNSYLPVWFKVSAVWGGHEGSLLLWVWILAGWSAAVACLSGALPPKVIARVLSVMGFIALGFISFMLFTSNPFDRLLPDFPVDGADLNPLLQDFGLIVHPPMLYMGYVGFSVAFAFAIEGLISGRLDSAWARWSRPWTTVAWCFLTLGIALGSWWAYYELGWGGWWFWDPVENASFMPWLAGTALIHSLAVTEKRGVFKAWTVLLAILAFSLSLLGTFLVRSGVLTSVHSFASDPSRGMFILVFLVLTVGGSLSLFAARAHLFNSEGQYQLFSREVMLMLNNLILVIAVIAVLLGTLFPLISDVANMGKISVGPPYFNFIFVPLTFILMATLGIGVVTNWKRQRWDTLFKPLSTLALVALIIGLIVPLVSGDQYEKRVAVAIALILWVFIVNGWDLYNKVSKSKQGKFAGFRRLSLSYKGMLLAHIGLGVTVVGVTMTSLYSTEKDLRMEPNQKIEFDGYTFQFNGVKALQGPNFDAQRGEIFVTKGGEFEASLHPEKRRYWAKQNVMTEAAIDAGLFRDLYVALGEPLDEEGAWALRIYVKPYIRWIWGGALLMAIGGAFAICDRRYRFKEKRVA